ncbi:DUF4296 domain-containing protein [uncultured Acetobacteroides sp.]|uniref:DUF4296 domain-containing protein n=1 Tax=uncultured Acetobacteroides sp. TaxID=1760811 RepID=UPI0029F5C969|nr:DUF4296 domain-containing protein [uncultured Acetobacteroides sp.]
MKKLLLIIAAAIAFASCSDNDQVLSKQKMANILRDIHISDAVLNTQRYSQNTFENLDSLYLYKDVFKKNDVSREEFIHSLQYYSKYPRKLDEIYTMVVNELSAQQTKMREDMEKKEKGKAKTPKPLK